MYCPKCGYQNPDDAAFCMKCGTKMDSAQQGAQAAAAPKAPILAPSGATSLKCPNCGAPISPKFGEMVITCEYCGSAITLSNDGWTSIQKQTMLPVRFADKDLMTKKIHDLMDQGLLHRHLQENSTLQEMNLSLVPYWIIPVSARTVVQAADVVMQTANAATTAALMGIVLGGMGGGFRRRVLLPSLPRVPFFGAARLGMFMGGGMYGGPVKTTEIDNNYNYPVIALKALTEYQPKGYQFNLADRSLFDPTKVPKGVPVLNGDIGEDDAKNQAKTLVAQLQSEKAHAQVHMIQQMHTDIDVSDGELLHAPIWFAKYEHKGKPIILILDGNTGAPINSMGLN